MQEKFWQKVKIRISKNLSFGFENMQNVRATNNITVI
jgi:hypothetical protein